MDTTDNFKKHTSKNPVQRFLLDNFLNTLVKTVKPLQVSSVLDVGCGEGFTLDRLYREKIGKNLEGIEYLDTAIKIGKKIHPHITLTKGDIYTLPYKDNSFDLVLCTEVLEHLADPKKALKELVRVSKKYLLLSVPNEPIFMASNFLRGKNWSRWGNDIEHINHWTFWGFEKFAGREKLKVVHRSYPFPWTMLFVKKVEE